MTGFMSVRNYSLVRQGLGKICWRSAFLVAALVASALMLKSHLSEVRPADVGSALASVTTGTWIMALAATAVSFAAVGQYDALFHGWLRTGVPPARAAVSGAASIALAQALGCGLATGTLARWRALPEVSLQDAWRVTSYVSFSFMAALGLLIAVAGALSPIDQPGLRVFVGLATAVTILAGVLSIVSPTVFVLRLPSIRLMIRLFGLAAIDTGFAAVTLWVLLPIDLQPDPLSFFVVFLLALAAGLLSGSPGGVGAFEVCMITLLPVVPEPELFAAILGFRLIYHALPATLALLVLAAASRPLTDAVRAEGRSPPPVRAEAGLARLPTHALKCLGGQIVLSADASQTIVVIGDPVHGAPFTRKQLDALSREADVRSLWPAIYKVSARSAVVARRSGWHLLAVSEEAWIVPSAFETDGSQMRQLRRKTRQANAAGVLLEAATDLPLDEMARVAVEWAVRSGGERGFSMGRFDPDYLAGQRVFLAWHDRRLVAFLSFHTYEDEWTLDLVRSGNELPNGTMNALVVRAVEEAKELGVPRVSLAAMSLAYPPWLLARLARSREGAGLRRFKLSFAPRTERLYLAAPSRGLLLLAGLDILLRVRFPEAANRHGWGGLPTIVARVREVVITILKHRVAPGFRGLFSHAYASLLQCSIGGCLTLPSDPSSKRRTMGPAETGIVHMNFMAELEKRRAYNRTVRELSRLPLDVALDLDIFPGDAEKIARRAVYGK